jgi:UDP-glucuronate decarboxylase
MKNNVLIEDFEKIEIQLKGLTKYLEKKRFLIVGGTGFIGTYLSEFLNYINSKNNLKMEVNVITRKNNILRTRMNDGIHFHIHDIRYPITENLNNFDFIFHLASKASPKNYQSNKIDTIESNLLGIKNLLDYSKGTLNNKFLYLSSSEVYGDNIENPKPISETTFYGLDPLSPRSAYAESKRISETYIKSFSEENLINFNIIRPFHTFGPYIDLQDGRVFSDFIKSIIEKNKIFMNSNGSAKRSFCYISDAIFAYLLIAIKGVSGHAYNVANPQNYVSILELANLLKENIQHRRIEIINKEDNKSKVENSKVINSRPSIKKLQDLGWNPEVELLEGFNRTINFFTT